MMSDTRFDDAHRFLSDAQARLDRCRGVAADALAAVARTLSQPGSAEFRVTVSTADRVVLECLGIPCCFQFFADANEPRILFGTLSLADAGIRFSSRGFWLFHNNVLKASEEDVFEMSNVPKWTLIALVAVLKGAGTMSPQDASAILEEVDGTTPFIEA